MDIHIGDFWQNKCNPKVIQHVVNFSFRMGGFPSSKDMLLICEEFHYTKIGEDSALLKKIPDSSHILQWIILKR